MTSPSQLGPFVLDVCPTEASRSGNVDFYLPASSQPRPAIIFVHGGPLPAEYRPTPRDWPMFRAYGSLAAGQGVVGAVVDHRLHDPADYPRSATDVTAAVDLVRADPQVDPARIALWFFSGGGMLAADWLRDPPEWLRCIAATYPLMSPPPGWTVDARMRPIAAVASAGPLPIVLTRVGMERPAVAETIEAFLTEARSTAVRLQVIDVPNGRHGFERLDHNEESITAVRQAFEAVLATLR